MPLRRPQRWWQPCPFGQITPSEAVELGQLLESYVKTLEATGLEERLKKLEKVIPQ
jgi:hypothetical protein